MSNAIKYFCVACFIFFLANTGKAQVCTGNLGAPIINISFGSGPNPGPRLPASRSASRYTSTLCPEGDSYTIVSSTANCYSDTWLNLAQDHTGDPNGYMMLINPDSSNLYIDTIQLCGGTTYEFAAFLINITNSAACGGGPGNTLPNVTLLIETTNGIGLDSVSTGDIAITADPMNPSWNRYAFFFTLPEIYSDVVMRIRNNRGPRGCGNDMAIDDITIRPCRLTLGAAFAQPGPLPDTLHFCESDNKTVTLNGNPQSGFEKTVFQWQESRNGGNTWIDIVNASDPLQFTKTFSVAGKLQYRLTASAGINIASIGCRTVSNALNVLVDAVPVPAASNTSPVCIGSALAFSAKTGEFYQWSGPAGFTASVPAPGIASAVLNNNGKYYVLVTTSGGCRVLDSTTALISDFPVADAGRDTLICIGSSTNLQASAGVKYTWTPATGLSGTNISNPIASPATTTTYSVTVGNEYNCTATDKVLITVTALPVANAGPDAAICKGNTTNLQASGAVKYAWSPATGLSDASSANPVAAPSITTTYVVNATNAFNCTASDSVLIQVFTKPVANAGPDKIISEGERVTLTGIIGGDTTDYFWTPDQFIDNSKITQPVVHPTDDITYTLHVGSGRVCGIATDDVFVHVNKMLLIPNAYSPNGDGINDRWNIQGISKFPESEIKVFNRYGQVIYYSKGYNSPWDGRLNGKSLPGGTYYYTIDRKKDFPLISGWVVIIR